MKRLLIILLFGTIINANANEVWLFGTKYQVFYNKEKLKKVFTIKHYLIDGGRDFETNISNGLSPNPKIAMQQVKERFAKNKNQWEIEAKQSWQGAINAQSLGIKKVPAITFDKGKTVIYGVLNTSKAHKIWSNSQ